MEIEVFNYNGLRVFVSPLCTRQVQVKRHKRNKRINKKWLKRYGTKTIEEALVVGNRIFMSQLAYDALRDEFAKATFAENKISGRGPMLFHP